MFQWARSLFSGKPESRTTIRGRYENATTTEENQRNWWGSDYLSAKSANSFQVRRSLRMRSRHEVANNPFLFGICNDNADDLIGTGPTLQVLTEDDKYNRQVEKAWSDWCEAVQFTEKLRTCKLAKTVDGEGFLILKTVRDLDLNVSLYPVDVEADQITTVMSPNLGDLWLDGITLHPVTGRPVSFHILKQHPGDYYFANLDPAANDVVPAKFVVHWFKKFRPGQLRGIPIFTSSLDLFSELRAFRKAVLNNAQIAAQFTALLETDSPAYIDGDDEVQAFKKVPIDRGMMAQLPAGMKMHQFDPKQPGTTYEMFHQTCLGEACRPLSYPLNLALGTSQKFNFSSSKLDHINYRNGLDVERNDCEKVALKSVFREWFDEAVMVPGLLPRGANYETTPTEWHWPGYASLDAKNDAEADHIRLSGGMETWRSFWASRGKDWRDMMAQQKLEIDQIEALGLEFGEPIKRTITENSAVPGEESALVP